MSLAVATGGYRHRTQRCERRPVRVRGQVAGAWRIADPRPARLWTSAPR